MEDRIAYLESKLGEQTRNRAADEPVSTASASHAPRSNVPPERQTPDSNHMSFASSASTLGEIVGFLSLDRGEPLTYVGSSSGLPLAVNLGEMVRASVMTEAFPSTPVPTPGKDTSANTSTSNRETTEAHRTIRLNDLMKHRAEPPSDEMGSQIIEAYFSRVHSRYPFIDRDELWRLHEDRWRLAKTKSEDLSRNERFGIFRLYMAYAIAATMMHLSGGYTYTAPGVSSIQIDYAL